ncbi:MAG: hypothetical protein PSW75_00185 [bacterium]|nr:hypothetical protein [bacterium]MDI1336548.1 hypothetical protein [Lacunisphaera sp.]
MKRQDYLIVALVPLALLLLPLVGSFTVEGWDWKWHDFLFAYVAFALTTFTYRLLVTRSWSNLSYRLGAGLGFWAASSSPGSTSRRRSSARTIRPTGFIS